MPATLKTAIGSYGHTRALKDGKIAPAGVSLQFEEVTPIIGAFRRMCRGLEFDVCEMAITTYLTAKRYGLPFTAIPVFPVRAFHHGAAVGNTKAGVSAPKDLEGKKLGGAAGDGALKLFPAFCKVAKIDCSKIETSNMQPNLREQMRSRNHESP